MEKSSSAFRTISEVAAELDVPKHVLRFWEGKFPQLRPMKRGGGRRYYRPEDIELLRGIRWLLYSDGYTIKGVQRILRNEGVRFVKGCWRGDAALPQPEEREPSFAIPNLAEEAAQEAKRSRAKPQGASRQTLKGEAIKAAVTAPTILPAITAEEKALLQSLLQNLEECRALLLNSAQPRRPVKAGRSSASKPETIRPVRP